MDDAAIGYPDRAINRPGVWGVLGFQIGEAYNEMAVAGLGPTTASR